MNSLKTILLSSVAAIAFATAPALAQQSALPTEPQTEVRATPDATVAPRSYDDAYGDRFAEWADQNIETLLGETLLGKTVVNDAGETIGNVDDFALADGQIVAVVGIGGFLGLGEHQVGVPLDRLDFAGDQLLLPGVTREELEAMPEYDAAAGTIFAADQTLRGGYESPLETAVPMTPAAQVAGAPAATVPAPAVPATPAAQVAGVPAAPETAPAPGTPAPAPDLAADDAGGWTDEMDTIFADIADRQIAELIGMSVASAEGEVVGEVDNFVLEGESVAAIVGVGGFLGMSEHDVALSLDQMTFDGEKLVLSSITEDQLHEMPEYDEATATFLPQEGTLRSSYAD